MGLWQLQNARDLIEQATKLCRVIASTLHELCFQMQQDIV